MAFKNYRKKAKFPKKVFKKKMFVTKAPTPTKLFTFKQNCASTFEINQATTITYGTVAFGLTSIINYQEYTVLFDEYRINYVSLTFRPMYTATSIISSSTNLNKIPLIYVVKDFDDVITPSSISQLRQYDNCIVHDDKQLFTIRFVPSTSLQLSNTENSTVKSNKTWIDCTDAAVLHYGVKYAVTAQDASLPTILQGWYVEVGMSVSFRHTR